VKIQITRKETNPNRYFYLLLAVMVALVVTDGLITRLVIKNNLGQEANPFLKTWVQNDALLVVKLVGSAFAAAIILHLYSLNHKLGWIMSLIFVSSYSLLIIWNIIAFCLARSTAIS
jgi:hypothetical protein